MNWRIENVHLVNPRTGVDQKATVVIEKGKVAHIESPKKAGSGKGVIDGTGLHLAPGLVDTYADFGEPGFEFRENLESGSEAAVKGGFTSVAVAPTTDPVNDNTSVTEYLIKRGREIGFVDILPIAAVSKGRKGEELTEMAALAKAGARGFTDGEQGVRSNLMRRALEYAKPFGMPIFSLAIDQDLCEGGVVNEGKMSALLGISGWPEVGEVSVVFRDVQLALQVQSKIHFPKLSLSNSFAVLKQLKTREFITAGMSANNLLLDEDLLESMDTNLKTIPPLRSSKDRQNLKKLVGTDLVYTICSDHHPVADYEKQGVIETAPHGIAGIETCFSLLLDRVNKGELDLNSVISKMSTEPASLFGIDCGDISEGKQADCVLFDMNSDNEITNHNWKSQSQNTPYLSQKIRGKVVATFKSGRRVYEAR